MSELKTKSNNIYGKLLEARNKFLNANVKKSGINTYAEFDYFELGDIVPVATMIFSELGLLFLTNFPEGLAEGVLIDVETQEKIVISFPYPVLEEAKALRQNTVQARGSEISYCRRYLYYIILDIVEHDAIDATSGKPEAPAQAPASAPAPKKNAKKAESKKTVTQEERTEIKKELTAAAVAEPASAESVKQLKSLCKKLLDVDPEKQDFVQKLALKTKSMTNISSADCAKLIAGIEEMLTHYGN